MIGRVLVSQAYWLEVAEEALAQQLLEQLMHRRQEGLEERSLNVRSGVPALANQLMAMRAR